MRSAGQSYPTLCDCVNCSLLGSSLSTEFSRQEYWSGLPFAIPGDLPDPGIDSASPALVGRFFMAEPPEKSLFYSCASV